MNVWGNSLCRGNRERQSIEKERLKMFLKNTKKEKREVKGRRRKRGREG